MPLRNLSIIVLAFVISLACYLRAARNRYVATITEAMNIVREEYVDEVDPRKLFEGAMDGMIGQLDEYSGYHPPDEYTQFQEDIDQQFVGIGIYLGYDEEQKRLYVIAPLTGTPAYEAGMKPDDTIVSIDGASTAKMTVSDASGKIKGRAGTTVAIEVLHQGETTPVKLTVKRASIAVDSVKGDLKDAGNQWVFRLAEQPRIGYIRVEAFGERTAEELKAALETYRQSGQEVEGLILDLRGNEGGLLDAAVEVCDLFLDEGVIVRTVGRNARERDRELARRGVEFPLATPMVVMVDRFSASAAEIVSACLQDHRRAVVVGQRSWGKGTVQNVIRMEGGRSAIRLTIARYFRPSGVNIHKMQGAKDSDDWGVRPSEGMEIVLDENAYQQFRQQRRERDQRTASGRMAWAPSSPPEGSPEPMPPPMPPMPGASEAVPPATGDSALLHDAQLKRAVEHLRKVSGGTAPRRV